MKILKKERVKRKCKFKKVIKKGRERVKEKEKREREREGKERERQREIDRGRKRGYLE